MVKVITGKRGSGKTKTFIDNINESIKDAKGDIICIENSTKLTYDVSYKVRLIDASRFHIESFRSFYGFIAGMLASNYDIEKIYVDGILRICGRTFEGSVDSLENLFKELSDLTGSGSDIIFTISADDSELPESILKMKI
ncbi:MAG: hypothetical protein LBL93_01895 [Ruminococcus sp.]|nr:hypothetical protein [Ruminococcus sp.]